MAEERIFITGGQGFFGSWICKLLLDENRIPIVFDLREENGILEQVLSEQEIAKIIRVYGDITNTEVVTKAIIEHNPTAIIHLAGLQVPVCKANPILGAQVNVLGTINVFEAAKAYAEKTGKPAPSIVYASSAAIFGPREDYPAGITVPNDYYHKPKSMYGVYKLCNEGCARIYFQDHKIKSVGLRPYTCFGVGREFGMTSAPTKALKATILGRSYNIPFSGYTGFSFIEDIARIFIGSSRADYNDALVFNIRGDVITIEEYISIVEANVPEAKGKITCSGKELNIMADVDQSALEQFLKKTTAEVNTPVATSVLKIAAEFRRLKEANKLSDADL